MDSVKTRLKEQVKALRTEAIMEAANKLLAEKGYESMTMDEVAERVGMSKASLYKFFPSKEDLAAQAMVKVLDQALALIDDLRDGPEPNPLQCLRGLTRWAMQTKLDGEMPSLPAQNSSLSASLMAHEPYVERLLSMSLKLGVWVAQAQSAGQIDPELPTDFVLYQLYARSCDPVLGVMKEDGRYSREQILDWMLQVQFEGLAPTLKRSTS